MLNEVKKAKDVTIYAFCFAMMIDALYMEKYEAIVDAKKKK